MAFTYPMHAITLSRDHLVGMEKVRFVSREGNYWAKLIFSDKVSSIGRIRTDCVESIDTPKESEEARMDCLPVVFSALGCTMA